MAVLNELIRYADGLLAVEEFSDYCPNGLQVEGSAQVSRLVSGVTASMALLDAAAAAGADAVLVHHGYFWKGEDPRVTGMKQRRLRRLLENGMSLIAYHLPLDAHPELGNNARLAAVLGLEIEARLGPGGIGMAGRVPERPDPLDFARRLAGGLGRAPLHVPGRAARIESVGWCTGAAQLYIEAAAAMGLDAYISGEVSEQTFHAARELGVHYFAAGHHATERYGVQALGEHLAQRFGIEHRYIDIDNPV